MMLATWSTKKWLITTAVALLVLAAGLWLFFATQGGDEDISSPTQSALTTAHDLTDKGDYDQALQTLKDAEKEAKIDAEKILVLNDLAAAAANANQLEEALSYYHQKYRLDPDSANSDGYLVGELYERLGQTQQAIESFKGYLDYLKTQPTDEFSEARITSMTERIRTLEGGQ